MHSLRKTPGFLFLQKLLLAQFVLIFPGSMSHLPTVHPHGYSYTNVVTHPRSSSHFWTPPPTATPWIRPHQHQPLILLPSTPKQMGHPSFLVVHHHHHLYLERVASKPNLAAVVKTTPSSPTTTSTTSTTTTTPRPQSTTPIVERALREEEEEGSGDGPVSKEVEEVERGGWQLKNERTKSVEDSSEFGHDFPSSFHLGYH